MKHHATHRVDGPAITRFKIRNIVKRGIKLNDTPHCDNKAISRIVCGSASERPGVIIVVMNHFQHWRFFLKHLPGRDRGHVFSLIKVPKFLHPKYPIDYLLVQSCQSNDRGTRPMAAANKKNDASTQIQPTAIACQPYTQ